MLFLFPFLNFNLRPAVPLLNSNNEKTSSDASTEADRHYGTIMVFCAVVKSFSKLAPHLLSF